MKAGNVLRMLVLALTAAALGTLAPAAASASRIVADTGFTSKANGYSFPNYVNLKGVRDLTAAEMRKLFGDQVCASFNAKGRCQLTPVAKNWMQSTNSQMAVGHCVGMAATAQLWFRGLGEPPTPVRYGSPTVPDLEFPGNGGLQSHIAYAWSFQMLPSVRKSDVVGPPAEVLRTLRKGILAGAGPFVVVIYGDGGGHAVTPTAIERRGEGRFRILIYDNNRPGQTRAIHVNTKTQRWSYRLGPGQRWKGDKATESLRLMLPTTGLGHQPCPFCKPRSGVGRRAPGGGRGRIEVHWRGDARDGRHGSLFVRDRSGTTGCGARGCVNGIEGARVWPIATGGVRPWRFSPPPLIDLPGGRPYEVTLGGTSLRGRTKEGVDVIGPGFSLGAHRVGIRRGERDRLLIARSARRLAFVNDRHGVESPDMSLSISGAGADYDFDIVPAGIDRGASVGFTLHRKRRLLEIAPRSGGERERFTVRMTRYTKDGTVTFEDRVRARAGRNLILDYGRWRSPDQPAPLRAG